MDGYEVLQKLGAGSYGIANLALKKDTNEKCVIKEINISHMTDKEIMEAKHEVQVLSSLTHPYVTKFRDSFEDSGRLLIIMDYCAGGDLYTLIQGRKGVNFPEDRVLDWFVQLCLAMKYIHDRRILHRDIKSQNVFLTDDGKVKLGDFGISKVLSCTSELARTCIGTPYYLSPEMCENRPYNNKSDIWALGCVLYEMAALKHAFAANNMKGLVLKIVKGSYAPIPAKYSRDLGMLLSQIFQREPRTRPSISVILRKPFIFKRIPRFITGCEEEELLNSLKKRKCPVPASNKRIIPQPPRRPRDVTDPAAKYGVSQSTSRKRPQGTKQSKLSLQLASNKAAKKSRENIPEEIKKQKMVVGKEGPNKKIDVLKKYHREKYPSENSLLNPMGVNGAMERREKETDHKRSTSVPRTFKNTHSKSKNSNIKNLSPEKLDLMLESAGYKETFNSDKGNCMGSNESIFNRRDCQKICRPKRRQSIPNTPPKKRLSLPNGNSPHNKLNIHQSAAYRIASPQGWLVDEFLSKKLRMAQNERLVIESFSAQNFKCSKEALINQSNKNINKVLCKIQKGQYVTAKQRKSLPSAGMLESNFSPTTKKEKLQNSHSTSNSSTPNNSPYYKVTSTLIPKETKDLVNKSLQKEIEFSNSHQYKQAYENVAEDSSSSDGSSSDLRQAVQTKIHSAVQEGAKRMTTMVEKRRNAAYHHEKEHLKTVVKKDKNYSKNISSQVNHSNMETLSNQGCKKEILKQDILCNDSFKTEKQNIIVQDLDIHESDLKCKGNRVSDVGCNDVSKHRDDICITDLSVLTTVSTNATASYCEMNEQSTVCVEDIDSQSCTSTPTKQSGRAFWKSNSQQGSGSSVTNIETKWQVFKGDRGNKSSSCPLCTVRSTEGAGSTPHICHHIGCSTATEVPICSNHDNPLVKSGTLSPSVRACWGSSPGPRLPKSAIKVPGLPGPISPSVNDKKISPSEPSWCNNSKFKEIPPSDNNQVLEQNKLVTKRAQWGNAKSNSEPSQIHKLTFATKSQEEFSSKSPVESSDSTLDWANNIASSEKCVTEDEIILKVNETEKSVDKKTSNEPIRRARWGSIKSVGLENSPLELTGSKMEATTALDLVSVFKERKQWGKEGGDIINVLSDKMLLERTLSQNVQFRKGKPIVTKKSNGKTIVLRKNIGTAAFARSSDDSKQAMKKSKSESVLLKASNLENESKPSCSTFTKQSKVEVSNTTYKINKKIVSENNESKIPPKEEIKTMCIKNKSTLLKTEEALVKYTKEEASDLNNHIGSSNANINDSSTDLCKNNASETITSMNTTFVVDSTIDTLNDSHISVEIDKGISETEKVNDLSLTSINMDILDKVDQNILNHLVESPEKSEIAEHKAIGISNKPSVVKETGNQSPDAFSSPTSNESIECAQPLSTPEISGNARKKSQGGLLSMLRSRFTPNKNKQFVNKQNSAQNAAQINLNEEVSLPKQSTKIKSGIVGALRKLTNKSGDTQEILSKHLASEAGNQTSKSFEEPDCNAQIDEGKNFNLNIVESSNKKVISDQPNSSLNIISRDSEGNKKIDMNKDLFCQLSNESNTQTQFDDTHDKNRIPVQDEVLVSLETDPSLPNKSSSFVDIKSSNIFDISHTDLIDPVTAERAMISIDGCAISELLSKCEGTITKNDLLARTETKDENKSSLGKSDDFKERKSSEESLSDNRNENILVKGNKEEEDTLKKTILLTEKPIQKLEMQVFGGFDSSNILNELKLKGKNKSDEHLDIYFQKNSPKDFENNFTINCNKKNHNIENVIMPPGTNLECNELKANNVSTNDSKIIENESSSEVDEEVESEVFSEISTVSDSETGELGDAEQSDEERSGNEEKIKGKCTTKFKTVNIKMSAYNVNNDCTGSLLEGSNNTIPAKNLQDTLVTSFQETHSTFMSFKNTQATEHYFSLDNTQTNVSDVPEPRAYFSLLENTMQPYLSSFENTQTTLQDTQNTISILSDTKATLEPLQNTHETTFASFQSTQSTLGPLQSTQSTLGPLQSTASTLEPLQSTGSTTGPQHNESSSCISTYLNESHMTSTRSLDVSSDSGLDTQSALDTHGTYCLSNLSQITENSLGEIKEIKRGFDTEDHDSGKETTPDTSPVKPDVEYNKIKEQSSKVSAKTMYSKNAEEELDSLITNKENFLLSAVTMSSVQDTFMTASEDTLAKFSNGNIGSPGNLADTVIKNIRNPCVPETKASVLSPNNSLAGSDKLPDITFNLTSELPFLESPRTQYQRCRLEMAMNDAKQLAYQVVKEAMEKAQKRMTGSVENLFDDNDNTAYGHSVNPEQTRKCNRELQMSSNENMNPQNVEDWRDACSTFTEADDSIASAWMQDDQSNICSGSVIRRRIQPPTTLNLSNILEPRRLSNTSCWDVSPLEKDIMGSSESPGGVPSGVSSSDSESDADRDLTSLRESMENILNEEAQDMSSYPTSEVWHLDKDGSVVDGVGGGVYGWIEEQRERLEDQLGLDKFMKAYHCLECAQEKEGCVLGVAVREAESILGSSHAHLASDVLQLVLAEAVYHR